MKVHGVLIVFRHTREVQHAGDGRGHQRTVGDAPTASSAKPEQLSKRKQRSSMRLADFRRRMEQRDQAAVSKLRRLWSVVWLQRLVRRRLGDYYLAIDSHCAERRRPPGRGWRAVRRRRPPRGSACAEGARQERQCAEGARQERQCAEGARCCPADLDKT